MPRRLRPRRDATTAERLVEAGERLIAEQGLDGVSLRQISVAAGSGDNNAVQYYFGDVHGLIAAILDKRALELELKRAERLFQLKSRKPLATRAVLDVLLRPVCEHLDARGQPTFARFSLVLQRTPRGAQHLDEAFAHRPLVAELLRRLQAANTSLPAPVIWNRLLLVYSAVLSTVCYRFPPLADPRLDAVVVDEALDVAAAALTAPLSPRVRELLERVAHPRARVASEVE